MGFRHFLYRYRILRKISVLSDVLENLCGKLLHVHRFLFDLSAAETRKRKQVVDETAHFFCIRRDGLDKCFRLLVKFVTKPFRKQLRITAYGAQWRTEVMRNRIGKSF